MARRMVVVLMIIGLVTPMIGCKKKLFPIRTRRTDVQLKQTIEKVQQISEKDVVARTIDNRLEKAYATATVAVREQRLQQKAAQIGTHTAAAMLDGIEVQILGTPRVIGFVNNVPSEILLEVRMPTGFSPEEQQSSILRIWGTQVLGTDKVKDYLLSLKPNETLVVKSPGSPGGSRSSLLYPRRRIRLKSLLVPEGLDYDDRARFSVPASCVMLLRREKPAADLLPLPNVITPEAGLDPRVVPPAAP